MKKLFTKFVCINYTLCLSEQITIRSFGQIILLYQVCYVFLKLVSANRLVSLRSSLINNESVAKFTVYLFV